MSGWTGPQEVSRPTSCSKQGQLEAKSRWFRVLSSCDMNTSETGERLHNASGDLVPVLDHPHGENVYVHSE